jgi:hypothetical protein
MWDNWPFSMVFLNIQKSMLIKNVPILRLT